MFKSKYFRDLLLGRKTTTIRLTSKVSVGDVVELVAGNLKVGTAIIERIKTKRLDELTDQDALNDGYRSKDELIRDLIKIYGDRIRGNLEVKIIYFRLLP
ncbi:MAG: ASCH domain-containing protein [Sulfolobales archaeon]|nr:ASCH domain-containing protein [Sulfolobales archaeon]